ncbi:uncharacterized protein TrAFT101_010544 [Trichoderma asperellum]|uniref:uncharacterized protein n=1 Tax=Trichoderma asperellum TaxID=101201 RepID=UPI00333256A9|nr:hypothetical protein TrAFT101_010544 [Trichoderma asperellum]
MATPASRRTRDQLRRDLEDARRLAERLNPDKGLESCPKALNNEHWSEALIRQVLRRNIQRHRQNKGFDIDHAVKRLTSSVTEEPLTIANLQVPPTPISRPEHSTALQIFESKFTDEDIMNKLSQDLAMSEVKSKMDKLIDLNDIMLGKDATTRAEDTRFKEEVRQFMQEVRSNMDEEKKFKNEVH